MGRKSRAVTAPAVVPDSSAPPVEVLPHDSLARAGLVVAGRYPPATLAATLGADDEARECLVPLPAVSEGSPWRIIGDDISSQYRAERIADAGGRLSHLADPDLVAAILAGVDDGLSPTQSAMRAGLDTTTVQRWLERGEKDIGRNTSFARFAGGVKSARECRRARLLGTIGRASDAGPQYWTAGAWLLERGYGNDYKLAVTGGAGAVIVQIGTSAPVTVKLGGESPS